MCRCPTPWRVGPDGKLYFPVMGTNEIWRIGLDGGVPDSVKFDPRGFIISTQVHSGHVLRIDPRNGDRRVLANLTPGLYKGTFVGHRLFVSNIRGYVIEILSGGKTQIFLCPMLDLATGSRHGRRWRAPQCRPSLSWFLNLITCDTILSDITSEKLW